MGALVDKSILTASFPDGEPRYDLLDTVRDYAVEQLAKAGSLSPTQLAHAEYFATVADAARVELRDPTGWTGLGGSSWSTTTSGRRWPTRATQRRGDRGPVGGRTGLVFPLAGRISEGRSFLEAALASMSSDVPLSKRIELLAFLCHLATEELDLDAAIDLGQRALPLPRPVPQGPSRPSHGWCSRSPSLFPATTSGQQHWRRRRASATATETIGAARRAACPGPRCRTRGRDLHRCDPDTRDRPALRADRVRRICRSRDAAPGLGCGAAKRIQPPRRRPTGARSSSRGKSALRITSPSRWPRLGWNAFSSGTCAKRRNSLGGRSPPTEAASMSWLAAHTRGQLGRVLEATGDADTAETLYRSVVEWSETPRPRRFRETLFVALAGNPAAAALRGLGRLAAARGDDDTADNLKARAAAMAQRAHAPRGALEVNVTI